jgi:signal peptidase II
MSGWDTVLAYNPGVTFGLGAGAGVWLLSLGTGIVIAILLHTLWTTPRDATAKLFALSIIVGGAVGNLYDRALRPSLEQDTHPGVRDFIDWYFPDGSSGADLMNKLGWKTHWYTFNVADAFIVSGVVLLAWKILREKPDSAAANEKKQQ